MPPHPHAALLTRLAATPPRSLAAPDAAGVRPLRRLADELAAAGLAPRAPPGDDVAALGALFDGAVGAGLGCVVLDYVVEVCGDRLLTSSDPVEAYLVDGACVQAWCRASLDALRASVDAAVADAGASPRAALATAAARAAAYVPIAAALSRGGGDAAAASGLADDARRLQQAVQVLDWAATDAGVGGGAGRGVADAAAASGRRRATSSLSSLAPAAVRAAARDTFLAGPPDAASFSSKLDAFAVTLARAGAPPASLASLGARFALTASRVARWRLAAALEDARAGGAAGTAALDAAVDLVATAAAPDTPWELGAALVEAGRPGAALTLLRARASPSPCLSEASACLGARLQCGLLSEGYLEARRYAASLPAWPARATAVATLTTRLAAWAARERALASVSELPLSPDEEAAYLAWLASPPAAAAGGGAHAVLYHLMRGRVADALAAAAAAGGLDAATQAGRRALDLLRMAARDQPAAVRAAVVVAGGAGGDAGSVSVPLPGAPLPPASIPLAEVAGVEAPRQRLLVWAGAGGRLPLLSVLVAGAGGAGDAAYDAVVADAEEQPVPPPAAAKAAAKATPAAAVPFKSMRGGASFLTPAPAAGGAPRTRSKRAKLQAAPLW